MAVFSASAQAEGSAPDREVSLTIYNKNIALIEHVRPISVPAGRQRIEFAGVSAQIMPETVSFIAPNVVLVEQNFDYDLLTPAKLMEKAVGSTVQLVRVNPATGAETRRAPKCFPPSVASCCVSARASKCCAKTTCRRA